MSDVARAAGVARVTVSRVIGDPDSVAPSTRQLVEEVITRLGYLPNLNAGTLASRRSRIVGAIVPTLSNAWFAETIDGLSTSLADGNYQLLLGQTRYAPDGEERLVDAFLGRRVDAIVLIGTSHSPAVREKLAHAAIPVIECWDMSPRPIDTVVGFSNEAAGLCAADHLAARGCQRLGFIGSEESRSTQRLKGFCEGIEQAGLEAPCIHRVTPPSSIADGIAALDALLAQQPALDGIFCSNDTLAIGVLQACRKQRLEVPGQLAVVGFSDMPIAATSVPPLTSVRVESRQIGEKAGSLLLERLSANGSGDEPKTVIFDLGFSLVVRESA